jgi:hypothetical protein
MEWSDWFQEVAGGVIDRAAAHQFTQDYDLARLELTARGPNGYYTEGQAVARRPGEVIPGVPTWALLAGGLVLVVVLLKS